MSNCKNCRYSSEYFRGLLCHWVEENRDKLRLPGYLRIAGKSYAGLESSFPFQLDGDNYNNCSVFEDRNKSNLLLHSEE